MNIILNMNTISGELPHSIFFSDKKKNIIMDGVFSKILYSNEYFTMNGIYLLYAPDIPDKTQPRYIIREGVLEINDHQLDTLCDIETQILKIYSNTMNTKSPSLESKSPIYVFRNHLTNTRPPELRNHFCIREGVIVQSKDTRGNQHKHAPPTSTTSHYIKISGIWETDVAYGITFKLIKV
jgi:hypothetical protein